jgi:hypothetical protein
MPVGGLQGPWGALARYEENDQLAAVFLNRRRFERGEYPQGLAPVVTQNIAGLESGEHHARTMFVRFRQSRDRLHVSIVETRRVNGKVRHQYVVSLRSIVMPPSVSDRIAFWQRVNKRLAKLSNRIDLASQGNLRDELHKCIPMVTPEEQRGETQLEKNVERGVGKPVDIDTLLLAMGCTKQEFEHWFTVYEVEQVIGRARAAA